METEKELKKTIKTYIRNHAWGYFSIPWSWRIIYFRNTGFIGLIEQIVKLWHF